MAAGARGRLGLGMQLMLGAILLVYFIDWGQLHVRIAYGSAFRTIQVEQYLRTSLKGNKDEFDFLGTEAVVCAGSLFPQAEHQPCWWVERHKAHWE